jgi:single-strand DNA-binding protein
MADINSVTIAGRLTRDAELSYTNSGMAMVKLGVALNTRKKEGDQWVDEAHFFDVVLWGKQGESLANYLTKGKQVAIEGSLRQNRWEKDGQSHSKVVINANNIMLLGGRDNNNEAGQSPVRSNYERSPDKNMAPKRAKPAISESDFEDDIPF